MTNILFNIIFPSEKVFKAAAVKAHLNFLPPIEKLQTYFITPPKHTTQLPQWKSNVHQDSWLVRLSYKESTVHQS